ncbi:hypothetical protein ACE1CI_19945 [Aerosakkonemataceae cyanobacterium BLCC-F50]|uniref:Uncharacterized protein n=1 Tax=Floridaenema flaviceps BLCC-F50 TaxID=3153642 RepID=A0ABV4XVT1_9CYAN
MPSLNFIGYKCQVKVSHYAHGLTPCLSLVDAEGMPVATATVNVPNLQLPPDYVVIKNYSENEGILEALIAAEIVKPTGKTVPVGHCVGQICQLTPKMLTNLSPV